ncbi:MAG: hypothetical protein LBK66_10105 [Spirochaetaceae bacterium]|jgi:hypothetical protein|nr:hypothetical protein [Spirochaetaceae bacterium]
MKFYQIDGGLDEAVAAGDKALRIMIEIDFAGATYTVSERDILQADFYGLKEAAGGVTARGEVLLDNAGGVYSAGMGGAGAKARVYFTVGEGLPWFHRFTMFINEKGVQDIRGPGRRRVARLVMRDLSGTLRESDRNRDWTENCVFTYVTVCDKSRPDKSLLHLIAKRAGLQTSDIDCCTVPFTIPYAKLTRDIWAELSELASAWRCHLECAVEKPLVFAHSPYQSETPEADDVSYSFVGENIYYLRETERADKYRNTVRLKINLPVSLEKQVIWRYEDAPVLYTPSMLPYYPFRNHISREIENEGYEARYVVKDAAGNARYVVYADELDGKDEAEARLQSQGGGFYFEKYDVTTHHDRALIQMGYDGDSDLLDASIHGRPIVLDLNTSCFERDENDIERFGVCALNVSGSYFSSGDVGGRRQYEDWTGRELAERLSQRNEVTVKTHRALFHARVGASVNVVTKQKNYSGVVNALTFHYRRGEAFSASLKFSEE